MLHLRSYIKLPSHCADYGKKLVKMLDTSFRFLQFAPQNTQTINMAIATATVAQRCIPNVSQANLERVFNENVKSTPSVIRK